MSAPNPAPAPASPQKKSKLPLFLAVGVLLAGGGVVAFLKSKEPADEPAVPEKKPVVVEPEVVDLDPFILNLADPAGDRYFRLNLKIVLDQKAIARRANEGLAQVILRDRVLNILSKKLASQMASVEGKEALRVEIQGVVEALFAEDPFFEPDTDPAPGRVLEVFFSEFLVQ